MYYTRFMTLRLPGCGDQNHRGWIDMDGPAVSAHLQDIGISRAMSMGICRETVGWKAHRIFCCIAFFLDRVGDYLIFTSGSFE